MRRISSVRSKYQICTLNKKFVDFAKIRAVNTFSRYRCMNPRVIGKRSNKRARNMDLATFIFCSCSTGSSPRAVSRSDIWDCDVLSGHVYGNCFSLNSLRTFIIAYSMDIQAYDRWRRYNAGIFMIFTIGQLIKWTIKVSLVVITICLLTSKLAVALSRMDTNPGDV